VRTKEGEIMDTGILFALVIAVLFIGGIFWLVIYSRKQGQKHTMQTSIKPQESQTKNPTA
jgi:preprotein translocase subunit YajC